MGWLALKQGVGYFGYVHNVILGYIVYKQIIFADHSPDVALPCCGDDYSCLIYCTVFLEICRWPERRP